MKNKKNKKKGTLILITTVASAVLLAAVVVGLLLFKHYFGKSEPVQYKNQYKISEKVWEMEPDEKGRRQVIVYLKTIPDDEMPDNINPKSYADRKKVYEKDFDEFFKRNSIDDTEEGLSYVWSGHFIIMYANEKRIRKLAEDESVVRIIPYDPIPMVNH